MPIPNPCQLVALFAVLVAPCTLHAQLTGELGAHDPSTVIFDNGRYYYLATGDRLAVRSSADLVNWTGEPAAFNQVPSWVPGTVPGYQGQSLWAPDVIKLGSTYHLYYSASIFGTKLSGIGHATSPTLDPDAPNYGWTDQGAPVISSNHGSPYNAIDPSMLLDEDTGRLWMTWGSFNNGIYVKEMNPTTGQPLNSSPGVNVAAPGPTPEIEGAAMVKHDGDYYLFVNWGGCCSGVDSTYNMRVGRSSSPTGPFLDRDGVNLLSGGGTLFLDDDGRKIGPGHFSFTDAGGQEMFSYHYYNGDVIGAPTFGMRDLFWTADGWPSIAAVNPNWTGAASSSWTQATNWQGGVMPDGVGHVANFVSQSTGTHAISLDGNRTVGTVNFRGFSSYNLGAVGAGTLRLDDVAGESATLNVAEGTHTIAAPVTAIDQLEINVTPLASRLTIGGRVTAPGLNKYGRGELELAGANSLISGSLFVKRGAVKVTGSVTTNSFSSVGQILGETGELRVRDSGRFTSNGDLNIGDTGSTTDPATGTLYISDNANVTVGTSGGFYVGSGFFANTRAEGSVFQTGGALTVNRPADGSFIIGGRNSDDANGVYHLDGGTVNANTNVFIGGRGQGSVLQQGGIFNASQFLALARFSGSTGDWEISGGALNQTNPNTWLLVGEEGQASLTVSGSGQVNVNGILRVGFQGAASGVINLDGGALTTRVVAAGDGDATLNLNSGLLRAGSHNATFLQGGVDVNVQAGGAVIDSQAFNIAIAHTLRHDPQLGAGADGGLIKQGTGVLTLTGDNTYNGGTVVDQGTLLANNPFGSATGSGDVVVSRGARFGGTGQSTGVITVNGGGGLAPGASVGRLTVGGVVLNEGARFTVEFTGAGGVPGVDHDQLLVNGVATLGGNLVVDLASGVTPAAEDSFSILTAGALSGEFENVADGGFVDELNGQGAFRVRYFQTPNDVVLTDYQSVRFLAGDYNGDGTVDAADYTVWRDNLGEPASTLINDPNLSSIGADQFATWRDNYGASLPPIGFVTGDAPEPTSLALLALACLLPARRCR